MNRPHLNIEAYKHHVHSTVIAKSVAEIRAMHRYEKSGAPRLRNVYEMSLMMVTFVNTRSNQRWVPTYASIDIDVWRFLNFTDFRFRLSYRDPKDSLHKYLTMTKCGKCQSMLKSAMDDMELALRRQKVKLTTVQDLISRESPLQWRNTFCTIHWTLASRTFLDLKYIGSWEEQSSSYDSPVGAIFINGTLTAILIETTMRFNLLVGTPTKLLSQLQMKPTQPVLGKLLQISWIVLCWRWT